MNRGLTACLIVLLVPLGLTVAQPSPASVFIDSVPLGASIILDGELTAWRTPALLRGLPPGSHRISLWKPGFVQVSQSVSVAADKVPVVRENLPPESVVLAFPSQDHLLSGQRLESTADRQFQFPSGAYFLSASDEAARMSPIFDDTALVDASTWFLAISTAAALASGANDYYRAMAWGIDGVSLATISLASSAVGELAWYVALQTRRGRFYQEIAPTVTPQSQRLELASVLYNEGIQALEVGDLEKAEDRLRRVVGSHPDSKWVPASWFRLAKIHSVTGRRHLAMGEYRLVAESFAQPEIHDRARQALADLNEAEGALQQAIDQIDLMVLTDGFFDKEAVAAQRQRLAEAAAAGTLNSPEEAEPDSPRESYEKTLSLFASGQAFTTEEGAKLKALQDELVERDDAALAADLELVHFALNARAPTPGTSDRDQWRQADEALRNRQSWRSLRDAGLTLFRVSSSLALGASVGYDKGPSDAALWTTRGALATMAVSLFPLLWAEPRQ